MLAALTGAAALLVVALTQRRPEWQHPLHAVAGGLLILIAIDLGPGRGWMAAAAGAVIIGTFWLALRRLRLHLSWAETRREEVATQLDRRISELFSLQELSYVLSESIQLDRIVEQVVKYAGRFLQAGGTAVVLRTEDGRMLHVAAAEGGLAPMTGQTVEPAGDALVTHAIERDRIEVAQGSAVPSVELLDGVIVRSAAVAPLRAHGVTMGALAVVDREEGPFTTEDLWLLSTVATQASVTLANGRLFEMVRRSKEEWETAFNALAEGLAVVSADGRIARANLSLAGLVSRTEEALLGKNFSTLLFGDSEATRDMIVAAREGERPAPLVLRSDPTGRVFRLTAAPIRESTPDASVVVLVEDVTDQRAMEAQLIQNEKMAAIGQLVSGVAHELNNPLTSIAGLAELLLERGPAADAPREHLRVIHDQAERASRIVRNLLTFARKGAPEKEAVDLNDVVTRTSLLIAYELKLRNIELDTLLSHQPLAVLGDRYELQQVLLNLVTNAAQALDTLPPSRPRTITISTERAGDQAVLRVRDSGDGVPPELVPYLFTPFFTTKEPGHGTGLGLSLSYGLVESHGGRLSYAKAPEGGAEFTVMLPSVDAADTAGLAPGSHPAADRGNGAERARRILVVDEDPAVHRLVSALFTPDGHLVEVTRSGQSALRLARDAGYDLVIADARATNGPDELFVPALLGLHPTWRRRLVIAIGDSPAPDIRHLVPGEPPRTVAKPFNLRDLRELAAAVFREGER